MTTVFERPTPADLPPRPRALDGGLLRAGAAAAAGAAARSLLGVGALVLLLWAAEDRARGGVAAAGRAAVQVWLVGHGGHVSVAGGRWGLLPLGLALVPALLCRRAGAAVARRSPHSRPAVVAAAVAVPYAGLALLVAAAALGPAGVPPTAVAGALLLSGAAAARGAGWALPRTLVPDAARPVAAAAAAAVGGLLAVGALLAAGSLAVHGGTAVTIARAADPGAVGGLGLLLAGLALLPDVVVWAASWLAGPGFALGTGTGVSPFGVRLGPVPGLPLLAAVPASAPPLAGALAVLLVPVAAGAVGGLVLRRRVALRSPAALLAHAGGCGALAGLLLGALALLAGGPLGGGRLAAVGPSPWRVAGATGLEVALGAGALLAALHRRAARSAAGVAAARGPATGRSVTG